MTKQIKEEIKSEETPNEVEVLKKEMDDFKKEQTEHNNLVVEMLGKLVEKDKTVIQEKPVETPKVEQSFDLPESYRVVFEKYFDTADGFTAAYDNIESLFIINVPLKLSNLTSAHKDFYKKDERVKKVDQNNILGSIDAYCQLVAQNLKYNKKFSLK